MWWIQLIVHHLHAIYIDCNLILKVSLQTPPFLDLLLYKTGKICVPLKVTEILKKLLFEINITLYYLFILLFFVSYSITPYPILGQAKD